MTQRRDLLLAAVVFVLCLGSFGYLLWMYRPQPAASPAVTAPSAPVVKDGTTTPRERPFDPLQFAPISPRASGQRIPVIMYHDIIKRRGRGSVWFDCTKDEFEAQMDLLAREGMTPITLEQLHRHLTKGEAVPEKAIVLTFDDNYQGFYDNAYPLLKERKIPGAMFIHTGFVGDKKGSHPKMDWATLHKLDKDGLITLCSHTVTHPDLTTLPIEKQRDELTESKAALERELGHPVPYFAYPEGKGNKDTYAAAQDAGYTMAFTIANGPVEESPGILILNRYIHTRLPKALEECRMAAENAPAAIIERDLTPTPITLQVSEWEGVKLALVQGGTPLTRRALESGRKSVGEFVQDAGAVAGINGTFFADASLRGTGNMMIGPCRTGSEGIFYPEMDAFRLQKLVNRPLIVWGATKIAILPFQPGYMNDEESLRGFMPDLSDVFLAGAWIVHEGEARNAAQLSPYAAHDFNDPRRRAFFGLTGSGDIVLGGTLDVVTTEKMARAAAAAGVQEAVLLDSGFSTSVVYDNKIIVTGHTAKNLPSRAVPHAIVLSGTLSQPTDPAVLDILAHADPAIGAIPAAEAQEEAPSVMADGGRRRRGGHIPHGMRGRRRVQQ